MLPVARQQVQARDTQVGRETHTALKSPVTAEFTYRYCITKLHLILKDHHCFYDDGKDICLFFSQDYGFNFYKLNFCGSTCEIIFVFDNNL